MYTKEVNDMTVRNLRSNFPEQTKPYTDGHLLYAYYQFSMSEDYGDNDKLFPNWLGVDNCAESITPAGKGAAT